MSKFGWLWIALLFANCAWAEVRINEVAWSGTPTSANDEWIELYNSGSESVSLENWTLNATDGAPEITLTGSIDSGGFYLLERTDDTTVPSLQAQQIYTGSLSNAGEELILKDAEGNEIDRTPAGEWIAGSSSPERRSMSWIDGEWQTYGGEADNDGIFGTPGLPNVTDSDEPQFVSAEPIKVEITEIAPTKCGEEEEWLEFEVWVSAKAIDMSNWKFRRGLTEKSFALFMHQIDFHSGGISLSEQETGLAADGSVGEEELTGTGNIFTEDEFVYLAESTDEPLRFSILPSPIGLPDDGGTLEILNENDEVLDSIIWEKSGHGTSDGIEWCEIWNRENQTLWPQVSWKNSPTHTRGAENIDSPAFPEELVFEISEIAPWRVDNVDFVELLVKEIPEDKKLPAWSLRHNGTELFTGGGEEIEKGERITLFLNSEKISEDPVRWRNRTVASEIGKEKVWESSTRNGLNGGSGTLELNIWNGTSWEQTEDFACWANGELSENEQNRLDKHIPDNWSGACINVAKSIDNESLARQPLASDGNSQSDFIRHFNGSAGEENFPVNSPPIAKIMVQGSKRIYETSLNLTGFSDESPEESSSDPDGEHDLKSWKWEINGKSCGDYAADGWEWSVTRKETGTCEEESAKSNPGLIYFNFNKFENFDAQLTLTDYSGASDSVVVKLDRDPFRVGGSGGNAFKSSIKKWIAKEMNKEQKKTSSESAALKRTEEEDADFFDDFIEFGNWEQILDPSFVPEYSEELVPPKEILYARDRLDDVSKSRLRKNIGMMLLY